jgi:phage terminase large subunit-like protein
MAAEFLELSDERNRRLTRERLKYYNNEHSILTKVKIHKKQLLFHKDNSRIRWIFGGNRTGKTVAGAVETVWYARGNHPYKKITGPKAGWVVSLTNEVQRDVAQKEILKWLNPAWIRKIAVRRGEADDPKNAVIDFIIVSSECGGESTIGFKVCEQGRAKFQGTSQDFIWFDEEPPREIFDECRMRVADTAGDIWGTMTPLSGLSWVYDRIYMNNMNDPGIKTFFMEWRDNPYLHKSEIDYMMNSISESEREARQYGRFICEAGLVYKEFSEEVHVIDPFDIPAEWHDKISIDPGFNAPTSCHFYCRDSDGAVYVVAESYESGKSVEEHAASIHKIADELGWKRDKNGNLKALIDSAADQRSLASDKSVSDLFYRHKIAVDSKVIKSKWAGIEKVREYLKIRIHPDKELYPNGKPGIYIFKNCPNLIKEIKNYRFKPGTSQPYKEDDHALDELRYYIMSISSPYKKKGTDGNFISDYKDKIIKKGKGVKRAF